MTARATLIVAAAVAGSACASPVTATVVTIEARPAVHGVETLDVTFSNASATLTESFDVGGRDFPLSFSVETPGRTGEVTMSVRALDEDGALAGLGEASATIVPDGTAETTHRLEPADYVVNTSVVGSQKLTWAFGAGGSQIAASPEGTFTVGFTDDCGSLSRCDLFGRRFDVAALPVETEIEASDQQFTMNVTDVFGNDPALAVGDDGTMIAVWTTFDEILAVGITPTGGTTSPTETTLSTGTSPGDPSITALDGGLFVVVWAETDLDPPNERHLYARLIHGDARPAINPESGSSAAFRIDTSGVDPSSPSVASVGDLAMGFLWHDGPDVRARFTTSGGLLGQQQVDVVNYNVFDDVWSPRIVAAGSRYLGAWSHRTFGGDRDDGVIVARTLAPPTGAQIGAESLLARGMPDSVTRFSLAGQAGTFQLSWEGCGTAGDGAGCGVWSRSFRATGVPVGDASLVNTTTAGDQSTPSLTSLGESSGAFAIAWTDGSGVEPDPSETGIRARVIYPEPAAAAGVFGAVCGGSGDEVCADGLVCIAGSDESTYCHAACAAAAPLCPDGGVCTDGACVV
jgi:hypothetical protein